VLHPQHAVQSLSGDAIVDRLMGMSSTVSEVLGVSLAEAEILCATHDWDVDGVVKDYVRDPIKTRADAGIRPLGRPLPPPPSGTVCCAVCCNDVPAHLSFSLWCQHVFCTECWISHVQAQVDEAKVPVRCMVGKECPAVMASFDLRSIDASAEVVAGFKCVMSRGVVCVCMCVCRAV
jgi:hypothetical protein